MFQVEGKKIKTVQGLGPGEFVVYLSKGKAVRAEWMGSRDMVVDKNREVEEGGSDHVVPCRSCKNFFFYSEWAGKKFGCFKQRVI